MVDDLQMNPRTPKSDTEKIRDFQRKLYLKAKQEKEFRFYVLYEKIREPRFLKEAYRRVKVNNGSPGVDGVTFEAIERDGVENLLESIKEELEKRTYRPSPVLRVYIEKANGKLRPLGIPTIKDRIVQMSCKMVIEPIFEADFEDSSYGFRPKRSAHDAITAIKENIQKGNTEILDADLSSYFDTIPHDKLMILIGKRISDRNVLHLIKMWLKAPVVEDGKPKGGKKNNLGTPQGGVISPLLANIYLHLVDKIVNKKGGIFEQNGVKIIRYADDFVLMGKHISKLTIKTLKKILERMELTLNEEKTKTLNVREETFDFLGFTIGYRKGFKNKKYLSITPGQKAEKKFRRNIDKYLKEHMNANDADLSKGLNEKIRGWVGYLTIPGISHTSKSRSSLSYYVGIKLEWYFQRKSQRRKRLSNQRAIHYLTRHYGLINMEKASSMKPVNALR
ncbi:MAG: group II intron reverse transcriptase/maturase [Candidatus Dehalobacter alkaniphilus]|nr:group II intron reverse transcriptase/maturase [Dehalobacter sp.]